MNLLTHRVCRILPASLIVFSGATADMVVSKPDDPRAAKLETFFQSHKCPHPYRVDDYIDAADTFSLDYRLMPALSVRESTCGLYARGNNHWGWDSGRTGFESVAKGIRFLARELATGIFYRGKNLDQKLHIYNPVPLYPDEIKQLMREIDAD